MRKKIVLSFLLNFLLLVVLFAADQEASPEKTKKSIDWFQLLLSTGYLLGVFILLPLVIYTNLKESLFKKTAENQDEIKLNEGESEEERNEKAAQILERIEQRLSPFKADDGTEMITITKGSQARFMKRGLDYINKHLLPTDIGIQERIDEFTKVYKERTKRVFTGSYWIIACSVGVGLLMLFTGGISTFIFIHFLGLLFYVLSSRTTMYGIEKRMNYFGGGTGLIAGIMTSLFLGNGVKHYVREGSGPWKRDWETEGQMALFGLVILFVVAMFLGFLAALLGVFNFVINYSRSYLLPYKNEKTWYAEHFAA